MSSAPSILQRIAIVGGGAAGWLTANHLACALNRSSNKHKHVEICLIESPNIPTIGVGEGTVPSIRDSLRYFGISETDLIQQCFATFKQSIEFVGWQPNEIQARPHRYHHIFDYPRIENQEAMIDWLQHGYKRASFEDTFSVQSHLIEQGLAPKKFTQAEFHGTCNYAYHFDAGKFTELLAKNAIEKLGVTYTSLEITEIVANTKGGISHLIADNAARIDADLFVDCTGARSTLLGRFLNVPFVTKKHMLYTDTALATQIQYTDSQQPVACSTIAHAHTAGWIWDIGLSNRRGVGIVYSSEHMSEQEARIELTKYVGTKTFKDHASPLRKIPMNSGYHDKFWQGNCVAIGMSQGFVEPLEATGLLMFDKSAQLLSQLLNADAREASSLDNVFTVLANKFNHQLKHVWDGVFDFIKLHYCLSTRNDSKFWRDHQNKESWSDTLTEKINRWQNTLPTGADFSDVPGVFNLENHLYVLFGMNKLPRLSSIANHSLTNSSSSHHLAAMQKITDQLKEGLLPHRDLLNQIQTYGLQRI